MSKRLQPLPEMAWKDFGDKGIVARDRNRSVVGGREFMLRAVAVCTVPVAINAAAWIWTAAAFSGHPVLLGIGALAYGLGLRHALDADHLAAIDNVTRNLVHEDSRPSAVGLYFSLGHSTVVVLASIGMAAAANLFHGGFQGLLGLGGVLGTLISALFLLLLAAANLRSLIAAPRAFRAWNDAGRATGVLSRVFRPTFSLVHRSRQMYPVGFLFGLGFDTAASVAALGIAAVGAVRGLSFVSVPVFAALFTAGMVLVDTLDGVLMAGACGWTATRPLARFRYNMTITAISTAVALLAAGVELLGLVHERFGFGNAFWRGVDLVSRHYAVLGAAFVALFLLGWLAFVLARSAGEGSAAEGR